MTFLAIAIVAVLAVFAARLVWVQVIDGPATAQQAREKRLIPVALLGARGQITDVNGVALATSVERYDISVNQQLLGQFRGTADVPAGVEGVATLLAPMLGVSEPELGGMMVGSKGFKYIQKGVLPEVAREIRALQLPGVNVDRVADRVYPNGAVAGNLIGFVNSAGAGLEGLEASLDDKLKGTPGEELYEGGRGGQAIPGGYSQDTPAKPGSSVRLTVDADIQFRAEAALRDAVQQTGAASGTVVVQKVGSSEILALADSGTRDPNEPGKSKGSLAASVSNVFEPGSTGKVITMAAALENKLTTPTSEFEVPYTHTTPNGQLFHDSHEHGTLKLTTTGILAQSSNVGTVMIGEKLTTAQRYAYLKRFGFGSRTGIELPQESAGFFAPQEGRSKYAVLFGQAVAVNALQATEVFATIANHGVRVQPHIIAGWTAPDGTYTPEKAKGSTKVVSAKTADTVLKMLESVVDDEGGTAPLAAIPGYRVAGKTGTAQNWIKGKQGITSSFIGVVPADDPKIVVSVFLHNPRSSIYGGTVAAPVFKDVASYTLGKLGVAPSGDEGSRFPNTW
ncbi:peptidoglycan D,D-transpeptidase FtsI family protein [Cellulomonas edaphi]|uniref:Penicillin-binding protein 2 n=1 Tax=Cellulomonas edaphi TaxID=3053468 RepID=A0ABT7S8W7_9CELL|nr:penicillin-binding protein 2 [Cellulomons edaphi]MDM7832026.1 penicillin-binding protein 2 [Cellulomons edaphi]